MKSYALASIQVMTVMFLKTAQCYYTTVSACLSSSYSIQRLERGGREEMQPNDDDGWKIRCDRVNFSS